jgi:hypothetical protein
MGAGFPYPPGRTIAVLLADPLADFTADDIVGIGYITEANINLADAYGEIGMTSAKHIGVTWQSIEPSPPDSSGHHYDWSGLDSSLRHFLDAGFNDFCILVKCCSEWGVCDKWIDEFEQCGRPLEQYEEDFHDWVVALVERYDGDGIDDMPGLWHPVLLYQIGSESQQFFYFQGCSRHTHLSDYLTFLRLAHHAVKEACEEAKVGLTAFLFSDFFDDFPDHETLRERVAVMDSIYWEELGDSLATYEFEFIAETLAADSLYDYVNFHPLSWYTGITGTVDFIDYLCDSIGIAHKPVVADDAISVPMYSKEGFVPHLPDHYDHIYRVLSDPDHEEYDLYYRWYRADQSRIATKFFVTALGKGVKRMWIETLEDWWWFRPFTPAWGYMGLVDTDWIFWVPYFRDYRPVSYTLELLKKRFKGYTEIERRAPGGPWTPLHVYEFSGKDNPLYCIWYDDYVDQLPEEPQGDTLNVLLADVFPPHHRISATKIITEPGMSEPERTVYTTDGNGDLVLPSVDETPVILEQIGKAPTIRKRQIPR